MGAPRPLALVLASLVVAACGTPPLSSTGDAKSTPLPSASASDDPTDPLAKSPIVEIEGDAITVDGRPVANARSLAEIGRLQKVDELFDLLKARREAWKQTNPSKDFPGVAGIRVEPTTSTLVLKDLFQTTAFAGYPRITLQIAGSPALYDLSALIPHPPPPPDETPKHEEKSLVSVRPAENEVEVEWKVNGTVVTMRRVGVKELSDTICTAWKSNARAHHDASDPTYDEAVMHIDNKAKASDLVPFLSAIDGCRRARKGVDGPVFVTTLSIN